MTAIGLHQATGKSITLSTDDRRRHLYVIGASGVGKSTLLESMALDDIAAGHGVAFIDPHGQSAERIADCIPVERTQDVLYVEYDPEYRIGLNVLDGASEANGPLLVEHIVSAFRNIWRDSWGANLEDVLRCSLYLLIDTPGTTLMDILRLLTDKKYRKRLLESCTNEIIARFWVEEFEDKSDKQKAEETRSTANKVRQFLSNPYLASIIGAKHSTLNIAHCMNEGKILILNLAKGQIGETPAQLLGSLFVVAFAQAAEERSKIPEAERRDFYLYVDEVQNFANDGFAQILSESRKMRLSLVMANQFYAQLPAGLQSAIAGNVGTLVAFRVGAQDAGDIAAMLDHGNANTLKRTANFEAWVRLMQNGVPIEPVPIRTSPPQPYQTGRLSAVRRRSRAAPGREQTS